jgi:biotin transport system substrate-specific component
VGLPVFAGGASTAALVGPTAGYLYGFVLGGMAMGWLCERGRDRNPITAVAALLVGDAIVFVLGYAWLAYFLGDAGKALELGVLPFLFGDACKIALVAAGLPLAWKLLQSRRR